MHAPSNRTTYVIYYVRCTIGFAYCFTTYVSTIMPSFLKSTLSLMALIVLLSVIAFVVWSLDAPERIQNILSGIMGAYIGSRIPQKNDLISEKTTDDTQ
jgi:hypothetical protein